MANENKYGTELNQHSQTYREKDKWPDDGYDYTYNPAYTPGRDENSWWAMSSKKRRELIDNYKTSQTDQSYLDMMMAQGVEFEPVSENDMQRTLIDELIGVIPQERINKLMPDWQKDAMTAINWNEQQFGKMMDLAYQRAGQDVSYINEMNRIEAEKMNKFMAEQFYASIDEATPGFMGLVGKYQGTVSDMLSGELPQSVQDQLARTSAERGLSQGLFGEAGSNLGIRTLGLSSLDYIRMGQEQMIPMAQVAESVRAPQIEMGMAEVGDLGAQYGASLLGMTTMTPMQAAAAGAQQAQLGIGLETFNQQVARNNAVYNADRLASWLQFNASQGFAAQQFNAQLQYSAALSGLNYSLEQQAFQWNYKIAQMQSRKSGGLGAALGGTAGAIGGAVIGGKLGGGPPGAAVGTSVGTQAGSTGGMLFD